MPWTVRCASVALFCALRSPCTCVTFRAMEDLDLKDWELVISNGTWWVGKATVNGHSKLEPVYYAHYQPVPTEGPTGRGASRTRFSSCRSSVAGFRRSMCLRGRFASRSPRAGTGGDGFSASKPSPRCNVRPGRRRRRRTSFWSRRAEGGFMANVIQCDACGKQEPETPTLCPGGAGWIPAGWSHLDIHRTRKISVLAAHASLLPPGIDPESLYEKQFCGVDLCHQCAETMFRASGCYERIMKDTTTQQPPMPPPFPPGGRIRRIK